MTEDRRLINTLKVSGFLSYGPDGETVELKPLNVLIGPNSSGKSNLIEAINLLRSTPKDLTASIREGGGISEFLWKGPVTLPRRSPAEISVTLNYPDGIVPLRYQLSFTSVGQRIEIVDEVVENEIPLRQTERDVYFFYRYQHGNPSVNIRLHVDDPAGSGTGRTQRRLRREDVSPEQSVLSQRRDPDLYPEITYLANQFSAVKIYNEWSMGRYTLPRLPQPADAAVDFLLDNASNLGLVINHLQNSGPAKRIIEEHFRRFYEHADYINPRVYGGTVQVFVVEKGLTDPIPATRLSDGTLRYLCLLTILCHPSPPPLVCIEEPELGLHPDIIPTIARLLVEASERTQLIVTTHSDALVSALADVPQSILICERRSDGTRLRRIDSERLKDWLGKYSLGELWLSGELGGTRW